MCEIQEKKTKLNGTKLCERFNFTSGKLWKSKKKILKVDILLFLQHAENQYQGNTENFIHLSSNIYWVSTMCQVLL